MDDVNLHALFHKRIRVTEDRPKLTPAARAAELEEMARQFKPYKVDYSITVRQNRVQSGSIEDDVL